MDAAAVHVPTAAAMQGVACSSGGGKTAGGGFSATFSPPRIKREDLGERGGRGGEGGEGLRGN